MLRRPFSGNGALLAAEELGAAYCSLRLDSDAHCSQSRHHKRSATDTHGFAATQLRKIVTSEALIIRSSSSSSRRTRKAAGTADELLQVIYEIAVERYAINRRSVASVRLAEMYSLCDVPVCSGWPQNTSIIRVKIECDASFCSLSLYTRRANKKHVTLLLFISSSLTNRFLIYFHWHALQTILQ